MQSFETDNPVDFEYPSERLSPDLQEEIKQRGREEAKSLTDAFIHRIASYLLTAENPRIDLIVLLYLSKFDLVATIGAKENSQASIAERLNITKQSFNERCKRTAEVMKLDYLTCNRRHRRQRPRRVCDKGNPFLN